MDVGTCQVPNEVHVVDFEGDTIQDLAKQEADQGLRGHRL